MPFALATTTLAQLQELPLDHVHTDRVRIGDWDFYEIAVGPDQAYERTLMVQFNSLSPHSYPLLLVRREELLLLRGQQAVDVEVGWGRLVEACSKADVWV